jgi:hypothetical protein
MFLRRRFLLAAVAFLAAAAPSAASASGSPRPAAALEDLIETVLETPVAENPLAGGEPCVDLGRIVAPLRPPSIPSITYTVKPGTSVLVTAWASSCSNVEAPPYFGRDERELLQCARDVNSGITKAEITVDGRPVCVREVETDAFSADLPVDNILGVPAQRALVAAHGWVALVHPLRPGAHVIAIDVEGTYLGEPLAFEITTTVIVERHAPS